MADIYFTIAGTNHHFGQEFFEPKMEVMLAFIFYFIFSYIFDKKKR